MATRQSLGFCGPYVASTSCHGNGWGRACVCSCECVSYWNGLVHNEQTTKGFVQKPHWQSRCLWAVHRNLFLSGPLDCWSETKAYTQRPQPQRRRWCQESMSRAINTTYYSSRKRPACDIFFCLWENKPTSYYEIAVSLWMHAETFYCLGRKLNIFCILGVRCKITGETCRDGLKIEPNKWKV